MCGIVGYAGHRQALDVVIEGLRRLEYRGYDSAGIAVVTGAGRLSLRKKPASSPTWSPPSASSPGRPARSA